MNAPRNAQYRHFEVQKIAGSMGADITGLDLSQEVTDEILSEIRAALLDNLVICIRDQMLLTNLLLLNVNVYKHLKTSKKMSVLNVAMMINQQVVLLKVVLMVDQLRKMTKIKMN